MNFISHDQSITQTDMLKSFETMTESLLEAHHSLDCCRRLGMIHPMIFHSFVVALTCIDRLIEELSATHETVSRDEYNQLVSMHTYVTHRTYSLLHTLDLVHVRYKH